MIGNAVKVMRIATGDEREDFGDLPPKNKAAQDRGSEGGKKRAAVPKFQADALPSRHETLTDALR